jgi:hypothetical protein
MRPPLPPGMCGRFLLSGMRGRFLLPGMRGHICLKACATAFPPKNSARYLRIIEIYQKAGFLKILLNI